MPLNPYCHNPHEREFVARAIQKGWTVVRSGWPDFLLMKNEKGIKSYMAVEVKQDHENDQPRPEQVIVLNALREMGMEVWVWSGKDGTLRDPKSQRKKTPRRRSDIGAEIILDEAERLGVLVRYRKVK